MAETFNHFPQIAEKLHQVTSQVVRKGAFDLQAAMQAQIRANGQIDTGFMMNSVYVVTSRESTYRGGARALPPVERPSDDLTAYAAVAAEYAWFQNYGTTHIPARPFLEPSVSRVAPTIEAALALIEAKMRG